MCPRVGSLIELFLPAGKNRILSKRLMAGRKATTGIEA
jgi:hypothetical protein